MKTIKRGERSSFGVFKREGERHFVYLMLPLFPWYGKAYDGSCDDYVTGWHIKSVFVRIAVGDRTIREDARESAWLL